MKEYIEKSALLEMMSRNSITEKITFADGKSIIETVRQFPAADVVSRAAFDQVMWERDVAIQQLREDYGIGLGEKKAADVVERKRGEWVFKHPNGWACSECGEWGLMIDNRGICKSNFCPHCGADMRLHQMFLCDQNEGEGHADNHD